mmetsp:Transcript_10021/g.16838  ORF Transcript_10021/g.16838 Transcript_10021/m.16838 type:complete len:212 (-) Transcript_10021:38-673(-)
MVPKINEMKGVAKSNNGWDLIVDSKGDRIKIESKRSIRGLLMMRGQGPIDWPPMDVFRCMNYKPMKQEWDVVCESSQHLAKVGVNAYEYTSKSKKKFVVASRDFVINIIYNVERDGTVIICGSSDFYKGSYPEKPNTVRGLSPISGYILEPLEGDPSKTQVTIVNELDLKGSIPDFALRQAFKDQGYQIEKLRKVLPKWKKLFPGDQPVQA